MPKFDYIAKHDVVHWTGRQILDWYKAAVPPPK